MKKKILYYSDLNSLRLCVKVFPRLLFQGVETSDEVGHGDFHLRQRILTQR